MQLIKRYPAKYTCRPTQYSSGCFFFNLFTLVLRFQVGKKGTENPGSKGLTELTFSMLFINDKLKLQWLNKVQNMCHFMNLLIAVGKCFNLLSAGEMH